MTKWAEPRWVIFNGLLRQRGGYYHYSYSVVRAATGSCRSTFTYRVARPTAEALLYGILLLQKKIRRTRNFAR